MSGNTQVNMQEMIWKLETILIVTFQTCKRIKQNGNFYFSLRVKKTSLTTTIKIVKEILLGERYQ